MAVQGNGCLRDNVHEDDSDIYGRSLEASLNKFQQHCYLA